MDDRVAIYAGSFDPPTNGHRWMIEESAKLFDKLIVAVGTNPDKKLMFTVAERVAMLEEIIRSINPKFEDGKVAVQTFPNQLLVRFAEQVGAKFAVRGLRNVSDFEYERAMNNVNNDFLQDSCRTLPLTAVFLIAPREYAEISSSFVKGFLMLEDRNWKSAVPTLVPAVVMEAIHRKKIAQNP